jgi:Anti-sigma-K factor rskA
VPTIPDGERGRAARRPAAAAATPGPGQSAAAPRGLSTADPVIRRRLLAGAGVAAVVVLLAVLLWPIGVLTGDDNNSSDQAASNGTQPAGGATTTPGQQAANGQPAGIAIVVDRDGKDQLLVRAAKLAPSGQNEGYYVWLYNSPDDAKSLGGQVTDQQGNYQAVGPFPADYAKYKYIDVTKQAVGSSTNIKHSGQSVLRGPMPKINNTKKGTAKKPVAVGQTVLQPPAG